MAGDRRGARGAARPEQSPHRAALEAVAPFDLPLGASVLIAPGRAGCMYRPVPFSDVSLVAAHCSGRVAALGAPARLALSVRLDRLLIRASGHLRAAPPRSRTRAARGKEAAGAHLQTGGALTIDTEALFSPGTPFFVAR